MTLRSFSVGPCRFFLNEDNGIFLGIGAVEIAGRQVRSGRLPWLPYTQTFTGVETCRFHLEGLVERDHETILTLRADVRRCAVRLQRDRNVEPVADTSDWSAGESLSPGGVFRLSLRAVDQLVADTAYSGFAYRWDYDGPLAVHAILDRCSWELDGDVRGATVCSQTGWIDPVARCTGDAGWSSELGNDPGGFELQAWPRWAVMQGFDFQAKPDGLLCGLFERVGLIRSILRREPGGCELKVLDRHVGNAGTTFATAPKRILLAQGAYTELAWQNCWSDLLDHVNAQARSEFGLREVVAEPFLQQDFWSDHTFADYRRDLLPAAAAIGIAAVNIGNVNRSAASEGTRGNQCCSHAYEPAPRLGGSEGLKQLVAEARAAGIRLRAWTSTAQGFDSPLFHQHRNDPSWFLRMEDGASTFGSVHMTEFHCLNLAHAPARRVWLDALLKIRGETGLDAWFLDLFPNVSFMPLHHAGGRVTTIWRECLQALGELQAAGIDCDGGSPTFVRPLPGGHAGYQRPDNLFINHRLYLSPPAGQQLWAPAELYRAFAHGSVPTLDLFYGSERIDRLWTPTHRAIVGLYRDRRPLLGRRRLVEGGVEWSDASGRQRTLFTLAAREVALDGEVRDLDSGAVLPRAGRYQLAAGSTYGVTDPTRIPLAAQG